MLEPFVNNFLIHMTEKTRNKYAKCLSADTQKCVKCALQRGRRCWGYGNRHLRSSETGVSGPNVQEIRPVLCRNILVHIAKGRDKYRGTWNMSRTALHHDNVEDFLYYCAKFQVIPIKGFRFIVLTYTQYHRPTHRDNVIEIICAAVL